MRASRLPDAPRNAWNRVALRVLERLPDAVPTLVARAAVAVIF